VRGKEVREKRGREGRTGTGRSLKQDSINFNYRFTVLFFLFILIHFFYLLCLRGL